MIDERKDKYDNGPKLHQVKMVNRNVLSLEGVIAMGSYSDMEISLETSTGSLLIKGQELHIKQLNLDEGKMEVEGGINALLYSDATAFKSSKGFLSKLLR